MIPRCLELIGSKIQEFLDVIQEFGGLQESREQNTEEMEMNIVQRPLGHYQRPGRWFASTKDSFSAPIRGLKINPSARGARRSFGGAGLTETHEF